MGLKAIVEQILHNSFVNDASMVYEMLNEQQRDEILRESDLDMIDTSQPWYALEHEAKLNWSKWLLKIAFKTKDDKIE